MRGAGVAADADHERLDAEIERVLHRADGAKNRPRALLFTDAADKERGVLFLADFFNLDLDTEQTATLAMDFGTSNTCLAVNAGSKSETLNFTLSPLPLWGVPPNARLRGQNTETI